MTSCGLRTGLLEGSRTTETEKQMIISGVKYGKNSTTNLLTEMMVAMKKVVGGLQILGRRDAGRKIDVEALTAEHSEACAAAGFKLKAK